MSLLSDFFKGKKKTSQTPDIVPLMPSQINPQAYGDVSKLAHDYTTGVGTGFGEDYVQKNLNPVAKAARQNYQDFTAPATASAYSARGLGRSSLAANELGRQEQSVESNIDQIMAQFYQLNEAQKKSDTQFGANLSNNILGNDVASQHKQADTSMQINQNTANEQQNRYAANDAKAGQFIQAGAQLVAPILNSFVPGLGTTIGSGASYAGGNKSQTSGATTQILGKTSGGQDFTLADLEEYLSSKGLI